MIKRKIYNTLRLLFLALVLSSSTIINFGKDLIRINPKNNHIECSTNQGRTWSTRYNGSYCGEFVDLLAYGNEILAATSKGVYVSNNGGRTWSVRYTGTYCGTFQNLVESGKEILATTSKGLYASTNGGRTWSKRR